MNKKVNFIVGEILIDTFVGEKSHSVKWSVGEFNFCRWAVSFSELSFGELSFGELSGTGCQLLLYEWQLNAH
jgi:hypothetical protein